MDRKSKKVSSKESMFGGRLDSLPRIDDTMTNTEFARACQDMVLSLKKKTEAAKKVCASFLEKCPAKEKAEKKYLLRAQQYYLVTKMVNMYVHAAVAEAQLKKMFESPKLLPSVSGKDPKDMN